MKEELKKIVTESSFSVIPGSWTYLRVRTAPTGKHFLVVQDKDEITVVTEKARAGELEAVERNKDDWALICLNVSIPFYSVGFLAEISTAIAEAGLNILIVSTYSKDY